MERNIMYDRPVLFICDRTACSDCNVECNHTQDIAYAKNFKFSFGGTYVEQIKEQTFIQKLISTTIGLVICVGVIAIGFKFVMWLVN